MNSLEFLKQHLSQRQIATLAGVSEVTVSNASTTGKISPSLQKRLAPTIFRIQNDSIITVLADALHEHFSSMCEDDCLCTRIINNTLSVTKNGYGTMKFSWVDDEGSGYFMEFTITDEGSINKKGERQ